MKCIALVFVIAPACAITTPISAQQSLLGRSCLGTFDSRKSTDSEYDLGAVRINLRAPRRMRPSMTVSPWMPTSCGFGAVSSAPAAPFWPLDGQAGG